MASEANRESPLPDPEEIASRANRQSRLYEEAAENPERVVPAMFIEDCARCEYLADQRRREGFYNHFYRTLPDGEEADLTADELPEKIQSAGPVHRAIDEELIDEESSDRVSVSELWERIGTGEYAGRASQVPLVHYVDQEDCYIHAEPKRVGFSYGLPVFLYKRRQSSDHYGTFFPGEKAYLWVCAWILHANRFFDPKEFTPALYFLKAADPSVVEPKLVSKTEEFVFRQAFPGVAQDEIPETPEGIGLYRIRYDKDIYAAKFSRWRQLYFGGRSPQECGECEVCQTQ